MKKKSSLRVALLVFNLFLLFTLIGSTVVATSARGRRARGRAVARKAARGGHLSRRERRHLARAGRRGRVHLSKRELRAERKRLAREEAAYMAKLEKRAGHKLSKRERAAEMRRFEAKHRRDLEEAR